MKVTHLLNFNPHQSGLYETARELIQEENRLGLNARFLDTNGYYHSYLEDRGVRSCNVKFLESSDVVVMHQLVATEILQAIKRPIILVLHGTPRDCLWGEIYEGTGSHSLIMRLGEDPRFSFVTMWPRHKVFWDNTLPRVDFVNATVDTSRFNPSVEPYKFRGSSIGSPNILFGDTWRIDKKPFEILHAFKIFKKWYPTARIHLYCRDTRHAKTWNSFITKLTGMDDSYLGEYEGMILDFPNVVRAVDFVVTPQRDGTRVIRESLAIGTPVVAASDCPHTPYKADFYYPERFAEAMRSCWKAIKTNKQAVVDECLETVERDFNITKAAESMISVMERRLKEF